MSDHSARTGLKRKIYHDLKQKLIHCVYPPGSELNELMLTEEYGVSRTPVREAVSQLELEGYVKVLPKKGIYIPDVSVDQVLQIFQTRLEIEPVTLRMAIPYLDIGELIAYRWKYQKPEPDLMKALELDTELHLYFIDHCKNNYLIEMMHRLFDDNTRMVIATGQTEAKIHNAVVEHLEILDNLINHEDPELSAELMRKHVETCRTEALKYFSSDDYRKYMNNTRQNSSGSYPVSGS